MIQPSRIQALTPGDPREGEFVLYWMQASVRAAFNHALEYAVEQANLLGKPLVVYFGITADYPDANLRHYLFLIQGLAQTQDALKRRGISLVVRLESPEKGVVDLARRAALVVVDRGYTRIQRRWRQEAARNLDLPLTQVESDAVVPVEEAMEKEAYSAAVLRRRLQKKLPDYLVPLNVRDVAKDSLGLTLDSEPLDDPAVLLDSLDVERSVLPAPSFTGGEAEARRRLQGFVEDRLDAYPELSRDPSKEGLSNLSPYLHFGHISPLEIALEVTKRGGPGVEAFLEELIVRRELSLNFVLYNPAYDGFEALPDWCRRSLEDHAGDPREFIYSREDWEAAQTHDPYWNAAQKEMVCRGKMHGYMRMYWGKKLLEWSETPEEAFTTALFLNNKYELDGRDPNGFAGVAWCFGKHDRPWTERPVFGKIRYMNANGLRRKFDVEAYVRRIDHLCRISGNASKRDE